MQGYIEVPLPNKATALIAVDKITHIANAYLGKGRQEIFFMPPSEASSQQQSSVVTTLSRAQVMELIEKAQKS